MIFNRLALLVIALLAVTCIASACWQIPSRGALIDFESEKDMDKLFWRCETWFEQNSRNAPQGKYWLKAQLPPGQYPGVRFERLPSNWRGYKAISFWAWAPGKAGEKLHLRMDDSQAGPGYDDRFNKIFTLADQPKRYCTNITNPKNRKLNTGHITLLLVFLYNQPTPTTLFLDDFRLVNDCEKVSDE